MTGIILTWLFKITLGITVPSVLGFLTLFYGYPHRFLELIFAIQRYKAGMKRKYVRIGNKVLGYVEKNSFREDKPTLLFLHGFTSSTNQWIVVFRRFKLDLHMIALDLPGHGESSAPSVDEISVEFMQNIICEFLDSVGLKGKKVHVIGNSLGGAVAGVFSANHPERVMKTTLISPVMTTPVQTLFTVELKKMMDMNPDDVAPEHCRLLPLDVQSTKEMFKTCIYFKAKMKFHDQIFKGLVNIRRPKTTFFLNLLKKMSTEENINLLNVRAPSISMPSQVIWGKHDELISVSGAACLKDLLPDCRHFEILEECGHSVDIDRPGALCKLLSAFVEDSGKKED